MSTTITIGGVDVTDKFDGMRLTIKKNKRTFNTLLATLKSANFTLEEGTEILVTIDTNLEFGGLVQSVKNLPNANLNNYTIYATSYEQICDRRTISVDYSEVNAGTIANTMVSSYLTSEGITVGNIDTGNAITYAKTAVTIRDVLDEIATTSGYVWFIDNNKDLYFQDDYNYTSGTLPTNYEVVSVARNLAGYANKVFCIGANEILAIAEDTTEETEMSSRFGSGVYGLVVRDANADTETKAQDVADAELAKRSFAQKEVVIRSRERIAEGTIYSSVTIPYTDVSSEDYAVDSVEITFDGSAYVYVATLQPYISAKLSSKESWQAKFKQFLNSTNTDVKINGSSYLFVQADEPTTAPENSLWVDTDDFSRYDIATYTTATTITVEDGEVALCNGTFTLTLFAIADLATKEGVMMIVKNVGTGSITVAGNGSETIDGSASISLASQYDYVQLVSDGTNWAVVG